MPTSSPLPTEAEPHGTVGAVSVTLAVVDPHRQTADAVTQSLGVAPTAGLSEAEVARRREQVGPNRLAEAPTTPGWKRFLHQFTEPLILILILAALLALTVSGEVKTPLVVLIVVVANAVIGFVQENRAERSLDALRKMLVTQSRVRRGGQLVNVAAEDLVPGDVVLIEAGDRVPADGRLLVASQLEIEEAALTGESQPTTKNVAPVDRDEVPLGDRSDMAFMNTTVTRGRGELVVTATGMATEMGKIAGLLRATDAGKSPLQRQLDRLASSLAKLAGVIVALVVIIGLLRGESMQDLLLTAVALAVASIPEGLPAVTAVTLALGVSKMAKQHAIVKRLASVETLGSTSVICSDKTGTLTLNQMTVRELVVQTQARAVTGEGYGATGEIDHVENEEPLALVAALVPMALCNDAAVRDTPDGPELVGDPTEGALVVVATKAGLDVDQLRADHPRRFEVPFDSAVKLMATVHDMPTADGDSATVLYVKGAPDVLLARSREAIGPDGVAVPVADLADELLAHNERLAGRGLRVLAVAQRRLEPGELEAFVASGAEPEQLANDLTLLALAGIVDPPRPEARDAIGEARQAGIAVKMITGDHAATAAAIGADLGLTGASGDLEAVTGAELDRMSDEELDARIDDIAVFARVSPEHKLRLVDALQRRGNIVAMTGDGVNDAPALKKADMGVAMGITGTEVTKEAATMVLTDDNFATIVRAVRQGRTIYDNIVSFVRFQLSTTIGFALVFLLAAIVGIASGKPFTAIAILWVNIIMDGPPAMALGVDPPDRDIMRRRPRPVSEPIITRNRWTAIVFAGVIMAAGSLAVLALAPGPEAKAGTPTVAGTMAFTTFVLFQAFNILNARSDRQTVFRSATLRNRWLWISIAVVLSLQVGVVHWGPMQRLFDTTSITAGQWLVCIAVASSILWLEELRKVVVRARSPHHLPPEDHP